MGRSGLGILLFAWVWLTGCATAPLNGLRPAEDPDGAMRLVMERKNKIVPLSIRETDAGKPVLLLLHGATADPTEMMDIVRQWRGKFDVYLYSFNHHARVETIGSNLVREVQTLRARHPRAATATVVVYSYSAVVFRQSVIGADDPKLFAEMTLVQLAPTSGGSRLAYWMRAPVFGWLAGLASKTSAAENPYGSHARNLWSGAGHLKFIETIPPARVHSVLLEEDAHSLADSRSRKVRARYRNGLGANVVVIPKSTGVTHDYLPTDPIALDYLADILQQISTKSVAMQDLPHSSPAGQ